MTNNQESTDNKNIDNSIVQQETIINNILSRIPAPPLLTRQYTEFGIAVGQLAHLVGNGEVAENITHPVSSRRDAISINLPHIQEELRDHTIENSQPNLLPRIRFRLATKDGNESIHSSTSLEEIDTSLSNNSTTIREITGLSSQIGLSVQGMERNEESPNLTYYGACNNTVSNDERFDASRRLVNEVNFLAQSPNINEADLLVQASEDVYDRVFYNIINNEESFDASRRLVNEVNFLAQIPDINEADLLEQAPENVYARVFGNINNDEIFNATRRLVDEVNLSAQASENVYNRVVDNTTDNEQIPNAIRQLVDEVELLAEVSEDCYEA